MKMKMKKTKVIVTRDDDGYVSIWPFCAASTARKDGSEWGTNHKEIVGGFDCLLRPFKVIFGFTPRKGSKETIEITVKRRIK